MASQIGGGEGNRTPVREHANTVFYERSLSITIPPPKRRVAGSWGR
jgi:hypothetical protein